MTAPRCTHYDIAVTIEPEEVHPAHTLYGGTIDVDCTVTLENSTKEPIDSVPFMLYRLLEAEKVTDASGRPLAFRQTIVALEKEPRQQVNCVVATLATPLPAGGTAVLRIEYNGPICGYPEVFPYVRDHVSREFTLLRTDVLWFPVVGCPVRGWPDYPTDFRVSVAVPADMTAVANGDLVGSTSEGSRVCFEWRSTQPDPYGRITVACAPFRQMAIAPYVSLYHLPGHEVEGEVVAKAVKRTLALGRAWLGLLPVSRLKFLEVPPGYGSEASPGVVMLAPDGFKAQGPDDPLAYRIALALVGHETIHQWNVPSREEYRSRFLDEGITHYLQALLLQEEFGDEAYWQEMESYRTHFLSAGDKAMSVPLSEAGQHPEVTEEIARGKGPWLVCVLHHLIGKRLLTALRTFFERYRAQGATLKDFEAVIVENSPIDLSRFFREWLWGTASSEYLSGTAGGRELVEDLVRRYTRPN